MTRTASYVARSAETWAAVIVLSAISIGCSDVQVGESPQKSLPDLKPSADFKPSQEPKAAEEARKLEHLIDALANRNPTPRIVRTVGDVPLFDKNYNWKEQARVLDAIDAVRKQATPEMWELLVAHENDRRYLLTFADE